MGRVEDVVIAGGVCGGMGLRTFVSVYSRTMLSPTTWSSSHLETFFPFPFPQLESTQTDQRPSRSTTGGRRFRSVKSVRRGVRSRDLGTDRGIAYLSLGWNLLEPFSTNEGVSSCLGKTIRDKGKRVERHRISSDSRQLACSVHSVITQGVAHDWIGRGGTDSRV